jgi:hypothetical protein
MEKLTDRSPRTPPAKKRPSYEIWNDNYRPAVDVIKELHQALSYIQLDSQYKFKLVLCREEQGASHD